MRSDTDIDAGNGYSPSRYPGQPRVDVAPAPPGADRLGPTSLPFANGYLGQAAGVLGISAESGVPVGSAEPSGQVREPVRGGHGEPLGEPGSGFYGSYGSSYDGSYGADSPLVGRLPGVGAPGQYTPPPPPLSPPPPPPVPPPGGENPRFRGSPGHAPAAPGETLNDRWGAAPDWRPQAPGAFPPPIPRAGFAEPAGTPVARVADVDAAGPRPGPPPPPSPPPPPPSRGPAVAGGPAR
ncbi:hypothetical protein I6A84_17355, partial [Frankia sp. CNm7]|nr:hypothetical protein [Frankia nepalensis]